MLSSFLNVFQLQQNGYGNTYYAAAVRSMLQSWHNFFFVAYDPGGFISLDKPPVGFWVQVISVKLFGFSPWSLLLPQALAEVLAVALLFYLVRRSFGLLAATLAALAMAITPVGVVMSRDNNLDVTLILVLLLATWAILRAVETGRLRWLLLSMALVGVGFNVKMLQAYLVLPALLLFYLLFAAHTWRTRLARLALALVVLLVISFSWVTVVDLTPASQRPYVGSSQSNSELELVLGYNGLGRLFNPQGNSTPPRRHKHTTFVESSIAPLALFQPAALLMSLAHRVGSADASILVDNPTGVRGPLRLFTGTLGAQGSWLLLFALISLPVLAWQRRWRNPLSAEVRALVLWGGWLVVVLLAVSEAVHIQSYYTIMLEPPISVLTGVALALLWRDYCHRSARDWRGWMLPLALVVSVIFQITLLSAYPGWSSWLSPLLLTLVILAALTLVLARLVRVSSSLRFSLPRVALVLGLLSMLGAPFTWSAVSLTYANNGGFPVAGPSMATLQGTLDALPRTLAHESNAYMLSAHDQQVANYLQAKRTTLFLVGTLSSVNATPFILATGLPVMALGGYSGNDHILTTSQLASAIARGSIRFFWLPFFFSPANGSWRFFHPGGGNSLLLHWIDGHCHLAPFLPEQTKQPLAHTTAFQVTNRLYDCA